MDVNIQLNICPIFFAVKEINIYLSINLSNMGSSRIQELFPDFISGTQENQQDLEGSS
jgi:hypothetical protein